MRRIARAALAIFVLAVGHAGASAGHADAAERSCGLVADPDGARIGVVVHRGAVSCRTAREVIRTYFRSHAPCEGSGCVRKHFGWMCATAGVYALPRLASCTCVRQRIAAYSTAD